MTSIQNVQQLQQCFLAAANPTSYAKDDASNRINQMVNTFTDGGSLLCLQLLRDVYETTDHSLRNNLAEQNQLDTLTFFVLTTIQRGLSKKTENGECIVPYEYRSDLRQLIYRYVFGVHSSASFQPSRIMPMYLRTKIGVLFSQLIQIDFPRPWQDAFMELIQIAEPERNCFSVMDIVRKDIFLRILDGFCDEVVDDSSLEINTLIKDYVRGMKCSIASSTPVAKSISADIVHAIICIFQSNVHAMYLPRSDEPGSVELQKLPILALSVFKRFISWLDLSLIVNEKNLSMLFECIHRAGPGDAEDDNGDGSLSSQCAFEAMNCLKEILGKGMEQRKKIELILNTNVLQRIAESGVDLDRVDGTHITIVIKTAEIVSYIGLEFLPFWENMSDSTGSEIDSAALLPHMNLMMRLFFKCFAYDDIDVSGAVVPLACQILSTFQKEIEAVPRRRDFEVSSYMSQLQSVMYEQMKYPIDFEFDYEDENDAEEELYRSELRKINQMMIRISPEMSLEFLCSTLKKFQTPLSRAETNEVEAALRLVYHYCEGIRPPPGNKTILKNPVFRDVLIALHTSDITSHPHREILILYYDIAVRYSDILQDMPELLPNILSAMSGDKGLQHEHPRVRSRSCYLLLKLVKALGPTLRPMVETAINGIQALLSNQVLSLHPDDSLYLFETIGLLLGRTDIDNQEQQRYLLAVISPRIQMIESLLQSPDLKSNIDSYGQHLAYSVASIAFVTKGFTKKLSIEVQSILLETMNPCLNILKAAPENDDIRNKIMIYLQRMIQCVGKNVLISMNEYLQLLIANCRQEDVIDVAQIFHQLCVKFKADAMPVADANFLHLLQKVWGFITDISGDVQNETPLHLSTELLHFKKIIYVTVLQIVKSNCTPILLSTTNVASLETILRTVGDGATSVPDPLIKKTCVQIFDELTEQWLVHSSSVGESGITNGFRTYLLDIFIPSMFRLFLCNEFNDKDSSHFRVIKEVVKIIYTLKSRCGMNLEQYMRSISNPDSCRQEHFASMNNAESQTDLEKCVKDYLQKVKQK